MAGGAIPGPHGDPGLPAKAAALGAQGPTLLHTKQAVQSHRGHWQAGLADVLPRLLHQYATGACALPYPLMHLGHLMCVLNQVSKEHKSSMNINIFSEK